MKYIVKHLILVVVILTVTLLLGCNFGNTSNSINSDFINTEYPTTTRESIILINDGSIEGIYNNLNVIYNRLDEIIYFDEDDYYYYAHLYDPNEDNNIGLPDTVSKHFFDDLQQSKDAFTTHVDLLDSQYFYRLYELRELIENIIEVFDNNEGIIVDEVFYPDSENTDIYYKFYMESNNTVFIEYSNEENPYDNILNIGFNGSKLEYTLINFSFDTYNEYDTLEESLVYWYQEYTEGVDFKFIYSGQPAASIKYTSLVNGTFNNINYNHYPNISDYSVQSFSRDNNCDKRYNIENDEINGEGYVVYEGNDFLFSYSDFHYNNIPTVFLSTNLMFTSGWDYIIASDRTSDEINAVTGVYMNDGTVLYSEGVSYYTGVVQLRQRIEPEDLTQSIVDLSEFGIILNNDRVSLEFIDNMRVVSLEELKSDIDINGIDMNAENLKLELLSALDNDIINKIFNAE